MLKYVEGLIFMNNIILYNLCAYVGVYTNDHLALFYLFYLFIYLYILFIQSSYMGP